MFEFLTSYIQILGGLFTAAAAAAFIVFLVQIIGEMLKKFSLVHVLMPDYTAGKNSEMNVLRAEKADLLKTIDMINQAQSELKVVLKQASDLVHICVDVQSSVWTEMQTDFNSIATDLESGKMFAVGITGYKPIFAG